MYYLHDICHVNNTWTSDLTTQDHHDFRSSEMHRLKALLISFPTHYRSLWSVEVFVVSVEIMWVYVDTRRQSRRPRVDSVFAFRGIDTRGLWRKTLKREPRDPGRCGGQDVGSSGCWWYVGQGCSDTEQGGTTNGRLLLKGHAEP